MTFPVGTKLVLVDYSVIENNLRKVGDKAQIESLEERLYSTIKAGDRVIEYRGQFHGTVKAVADNKAWVRSDNGTDLFSELHELRKEI